LVTPTLALMLVASSTVAQQVDTKEEKELTALGHKVDKASASTDPGQVNGKIVEQWKGTPFRFDASGAPRELTAQDVRDLRQKKLGYGEISILLAVTAKQPDGHNAKSVNEILAMRKAGAGWGKVAHALGYPSLGAVKQSVKATDASVERAAATGKPEKVSRLEKADKPEKAEKPEKPERVRVEKPERLEKSGR
jgi:hypothetical protein